MGESIQICKLTNNEEAHECTLMMINSDPWLTLGLKYDALIKMFHDNLNEVYVARDSKNTLGFIVISMQGTFKGYIKCIAVSEKARNRGVGSMLIEYAERRIFKETPNIFICVSSFNKNAAKLYERKGYKLIGEIENFFIKGYSELFLRKTKGPLIGYRNQ
ncbi:MAG TPA: GNAT family N-acetyltransferase [Victivallales bacterium]|nr:GNAT family N-acetyltransferase [Victivallales bacterium]